MINHILNFVFPSICGFCGKINSNNICTECCTNIVQTNKVSQVLKYSNTNFYFNEHFYLFPYTQEIRNIILQYKFNDKSYLYKTLSNLFISDSTFQNFIKKYDCLTSVPLSSERLRTRGYNQSGLIAKEISKHFNIPYLPNILIKSKNIVAQSTLNKADRITNIQGVFSLNTKKLQSCNLQNCNLKNIAIFDDIFTTGATANECARIIQKLNPNKIGIITIAKD